jgi:hypothetical protein
MWARVSTKIKLERVRDKMACAMAEAWQLLTWRSSSVRHYSSRSTEAPWRDAAWPGGGWSWRRTSRLGYVDVDRGWDEAKATAIRKIVPEAPAADQVEVQELKMQRFSLVSWWWEFMHMHVRWRTSKYFDICMAREVIFRWFGFQPPHGTTEYLSEEDVSTNQEIHMT